MKIVPQKKNMSQLRKEILESIEEHLKNRGMLKLTDILDQDKPIGELDLSDEEQLALLIFIEKTWQIRFSDNAAVELAKNMNVGTMSHLITIVIRIMNGGE